MVLNIYLNPRVLETTFSTLTWKWTLSSLMILIFFSASYGTWNRGWSFQDVFSGKQADNWHEKARNVCAEVQSMGKKEKGLTEHSSHEVLWEPVLLWDAVRKKMKKPSDKYSLRHFTIAITWVVLLSSVLSVVTTCIHEFIWRKQNVLSHFFKIRRLGDDSVIKVLAVKVWTVCSYLQHTWKNMGALTHTCISDCGGAETGGSQSLVVQTV